MAKKPPTVHTTDMESAASDAYSGMEELKDELQEWLDNMPESLRNGSKADELQEAIDTIDGVSEIDIPDCISNGKDVPQVSYVASKKSSRAGRRDTITSMLSGAADAGREYIEQLNALEFDAGGVLITPPDGGEDWTEGLPASENERDSWVSDIESFIDEVESAQSEYDNVNFPGMR